MKGFRFYAAMPEARKSKSASKANPFFPWTRAALRDKCENEGFRCDVVAVPLENGGPVWVGGTLCFEAIATAIEGNPHSYCTTSAHRDWVRDRCTRIPENLARELSPELFNYLES